MKSLLNPYIHFKNETRQAMEFYKSVFGGKLTMSTFKEYGASPTPEEENNIMHAMLEAENGITFMASDTPSIMTVDPGNTITMCLNGDNKQELEAYWSKLAENGKVNVPLSNSPWGDSFGMLVDKFGIEWMVNIYQAK